MKTTIAGLALLFIILLVSCRVPAIIVVQKKDRLPAHYDHIMVAAVLSDSSFRYEMENKLCTYLARARYHAMPVDEEFEKNGLANISQEDTYIKLCEKGIDAVLIITIIDNEKEKKIALRKSSFYSDNYFYNRIWNYKNMVAGTNPESSPGGTYYCEAILFNLSTLEAVSTIRSASFHAKDMKKRGYDFANLLVQRMIKEKILEKNKAQKAF